MRDGKKHIALQSLEGFRRGPTPLFSSQLRNPRAACQIVRCAEARGYGQPLSTNTLILGPEPQQATRGLHNDASLRHGTARTSQPSVKQSKGIQVPRESIRGTGGWLWIYLVGSVLLTTINSMGLSGWFFDYPVPLMVVIFLLLASPLALIPLKSRRAPQWNIAVLWIVVALMTLRSLNVFVLPLDSEGQAPLRGEELVATALTLSTIVSVSLGWAIVWTRYFTQLVRVKNTFSAGPPAGT